MKTLIVVFTTIALMVFTGCLKNKMKPLEYSDAIVDDYERIALVYHEFLSALESNEFEVAENLRKRAIEVSDSVILKTKARGEFSTGDLFSKSAVEYFTFANEIAENDFKQLIELCSKRFIEEQKENFEDKNVWNYEMLLSKIDSIYNKISINDSTALAKFAKEQQQFAKKHNFILKQ